MTEFFETRMVKVGVNKSGLLRLVYWNDMPIYVALLRGIAPSGKNMQNEKLRGVFEELGFKDVVSVVSSGNVVFSSAMRSPRKIEQMLEKAWPEKLGFQSTTIVRSQSELLALVKKDPFKGFSHSPKTSLNVTFLQSIPENGKSLDDGRGYQVVQSYEREICSVVDTTTAKTPDLMRLLEKKFGKQITTRTWQTVQRVLAKMEGIWRRLPNTLWDLQHFQGSQLSD